MTGLSTHVLDAASGGPAVGLGVALLDADRVEIAVGLTNSDGRIPDFGVGPLSSGTHHLVFATGTWFADHDVVGFYPEIDICFEVTDTARHLHVPVLLSPYSYTTYRGS